MIAKTSKSIDEASLQFSKVAQLPNLGPAPSYRVGKDKCDKRLPVIYTYLAFDHAFLIEFAPRTE